MDSTVVISILTMAGLGFFFATILAFVSKKMKIKTNPLVERIEGALPGVNCGACGFTSCGQYAEALAREEAPIDGCKAGGSAVVCTLGGILGKEVKEGPKKIAVVHCGADSTIRKKKAIYAGIATCKAAANTMGGEILCQYGCLGYGDCREACPFGAIEIVNGLPKIYKEKCTACGKCVSACPRKIISVEEITKDEFIYVSCSSLAKGAQTRKACPVGCIACGLCQKFTGGIFFVKDNLAYVQYDKIADIKNKDEVINKCPTKCITK
ncbi:MAG: RnfABCDGE type electron transport complex subunit B [Candidatus Omnitrophota bacterium]